MSDFSTARSVRARKPHRCEECFRTIRAGEMYWFTAGKWEGEFFTFTACDYCTTARGRVSTRDWAHSVAQGGQGWSGEWADVAAEEPDPAWRAHLWRLVAGHRRQWTRRDGSLMDMPPVPGEGWGGATFTNPPTEGP